MLTWMNASCLEAEELGERWPYLDREKNQCQVNA